MLSASGITDGDGHIGRHTKRSPAERGLGRSSRVAADGHDDDGQHRVDYAWPDRNDQRRRRRGHLLDVERQPDNVRVAPGDFSHFCITSRGTVTVPLLEPYSIIDPRRTQFDLRFSKRLNLGQRLRLETNLDVYNVFNTSAVMAFNANYGAQWRRPIANALSGGAIMNARLFQLGGRVNF